MPLVKISCNCEIPEKSYCPMKQYVVGAAPQRCYVMVNSERITDEPWQAGTTVVTWYGQVVLTTEATMTYDQAQDVARALNAAGLSPKI